MHDLTWFLISFVLTAATIEVQESKTSIETIHLGSVLIETN